MSERVALLICRWCDPDPFEIDRACEWLAGVPASDDRVLGFEPDAAIEPRRDRNA